MTIPITSETIVTAVICGLLGLLAAYALVIKPRRPDPWERHRAADERTKVQIMAYTISLRTLYEAAQHSSSAEFIAYVIYRISLEWGDNDAYREIRRRYYTVTNTQFDFSSPQPILTAEQLKQEIQKTRYR